MFSKVDTDLGLKLAIGLSKEKRAWSDEYSAVLANSKSVGIWVSCRVSDLEQVSSDVTFGNKFPRVVVNIDDH
jgi:hypothetical protein